jgi:hypothetical protein
MVNLGYLDLRVSRLAQVFHVLQGILIFQEVQGGQLVLEDPNFHTKELEQVLSSSS